MSPLQLSTGPAVSDATGGHAGGGTGPMWVGSSSQAAPGGLPELIGRVLPWAVLALVAWRWLR